MKDNTCAQQYWPFSLAVYGADAVAPSCLDLQDDIGVDVNVLLLSLLASWVRQKPLATDEIARADAYIECWRNDVVVPLRKIRRTLKGGVTPAPVTTSEPLRTAIKGVELDAERIQQKVLADWFDALPVASPQVTGPAELLEVGRRVVRFYQGAGAGERRLSQACLNERADVVALAAARVLQAG